MVRRNRVPQRQLPPTHLLQRNASLSTIQTQEEKTNDHYRARSHSPFFRNRRKNDGKRVCFSNEPPIVHPPTQPYLTEAEIHASFYSVRSIRSFDAFAVGTNSEVLLTVVIFCVFDFFTERRYTKIR